MEYSRMTMDLATRKLPSPGPTLTLAVPFVPSTESSCVPARLEAKLACGLCRKQIAKKSVIVGEKCLESKVEMQRESMTRAA